MSAYRISSPPKKFNHADTPGPRGVHQEHGDGASTAGPRGDIVDQPRACSRKPGATTHIASFLGIPNLLVAINNFETWWMAGRTCFSSCRRIFSLLPRGSVSCRAMRFPLARSRRHVFGPK